MSSVPLSRPVEGFNVARTATHLLALFPLQSCSINSATAVVTASHTALWHAEPLPRCWFLSYRDYLVNPLDYTLSTWLHVNLVLLSPRKADRHCSGCSHANHLDWVICDVRQMAVRSISAQFKSRNLYIKYARTYVRSVCKISILHSHVFARFLLLVWIPCRIRD